MICRYKIKEIGNFFGGLTGKSKEDFDNGNARYVSYMTVFSNYQLPNIISDTVTISENEKQNRIKKGDILFTGSSETPDECGMSCVVTKDVDDNVYLNSFCFGLRLNKPIAIPEYLSHFFRCNYARKQITKTANGVTRFNISKKKFSDIEILIPPIKVQEEIVKILDSFTNLIDVLNEELSLRQKQFEYYREKLLTFDETVERLSFGNDFSLKARIGWQGLTKKEYRKSGDYYLITGTDFKDGNQIDFSTCVYVDEERYRQDPSIQIKPNDVLITKDGTLGKVAFIEKMDKPATLNGGVFVVRSKVDGVIPKYVAYYLSSSIFKNWIEQNHTNGSIMHLTQKLLVKFEIAIPSIEVQQSIVEKLDVFESLIYSLKEEIALRQKQYEYYREKLLTFE